MKSLFTALVVLGLSLGASAAMAADSRNVTVINETGYAIKFLGFNAPDDGLEEWDNELDKTLKNQDSTYVEFDDDDEGCVWNVKVTWQITTRRCSGKTSTFASLRPFDCAMIWYQDDVLHRGVTGGKPCRRSRRGASLVADGRSPIPLSAQRRPPSSRAAILLNVFKLICLVQSLAKISRFRRRANQRYQLAPSFPGKRGVSRSSRNAGEDAVDAAASARR